MGKTLILIDGHALAFRQYYALERTNMQTSDNLQTWAVYGFFKAIFDLLENKNINPDSLVVTFDVSRHTFRTDMYDDYKGQREAMPDSLHQQLGYICEGLKAFNIPIYTKEGFEADDLIGTISKMASEKGDKTYILTGDQDSFQLIDKEGLIQVLIPYGGKLIQYDWEKVFEKWGVYPNQVIDYKALRGDVSDNIPGVKGIGEKTAQKLLAQYQTLENILTDCENLTPPSVKTKLCEGKDMALLSQKLATIIRNVDIDFDFESAKVELPNMEESLAFLRKYQLNSFIKNIDKIMRAFNKGEKIETIQQKPQQSQPQSQPTQQSLFETPQLTQNADGSMQLGLFSDVAKDIVNDKSLAYEKEILKDDISSLVSKIKGEKVFALDIVSNFKNAINSEIIALTFALKDKVYYVPSNEKVLSDLKEIFEDENIKKITYNGKDNINILKNIGISLDGIEFDVTLASYIKNPANKHDLDVQALNFIGYIMENMPDSIKVKKDVYDYKRAMEDELFRFSSDRAFVTFELAKYWKENLDEKELKLLSDFEIPLLYVLADMEFVGVSMDKDYLQELSKEMEAEIKDYEEKIYQIAGETFNINSPKQVSEILFDKLELKGKKKKKSTGAEVLEELAEEHEICKYILEVRKYAKLKNTYTDSLPELIDRDERVHTTYNQTVTTTGRLSSSNPNLQNIPTRTKEGNKLRACIIPRDRENLILSADYSQIELRLLAHVSKDENLIEAFRTNHDVHTITASKVFGVPVEEVTKEMRYKSKAVNFGIIYGQTKYGLAKALGISANEAQDFIDRYFMTYPRVYSYMENTVAFALSHGYVETIFGRKRYVQNELSSPNHMIREFGKRAAINQPLQGTAADLIKLAMIETYRQLNNHNLKSKMVMQVHDELVIEVQKEEQDEVKEIVVKAMELNQPLAIPLKVDVNLGRTWQEQ